MDRQGQRCVAMAESQGAVELVLARAHNRTWLLSLCVLRKAFSRFLKDDIFVQHEESVYGDK